MIIAVPGYPKERDLYQASRAMNTIIYGPEPVVNQGGSLIIPAPCQDGFGHPDVYNFMTEFDTPSDLLKHVKNHGVPAGGSRIAYKLSQILQIAEIYWTDCLIESRILEKIHLKTTGTLQQAIDEVVARKHPGHVLVMPYAITTIPVLNEKI